MNRVRFLGLLAAAPLALAGKAKAATDFRTENKAIESFTYGNVARAYDLREFGGGLTPKFFQQVNRDGLLERRIPHTVLVGEHPSAWTRIGPGLWAHEAPAKVVMKYWALTITIRTNKYVPAHLAIVEFKKGESV